MIPNLTLYICADGIWSVLFTLLMVLIIYAIKEIYTSLMYKYNVKLLEKRISKLPNSEYCYPLYEYNKLEAFVFNFSSKKIWFVTYWDTKSILFEQICKVIIYVGNDILFYKESKTKTSFIGADFRTKMIKNVSDIKSAQNIRMQIICTDKDYDQFNLILNEYPINYELKDPTDAFTKAYYKRLDEVKITFGYVAKIIDDYDNK